MALSTYTAKQFWREAARDFAWMKPTLNDFEKFNLMNRVVEEIGTQFYVVAQAFYMTPVVLVNETGGLYLSSGGSWNGTTQVLSGTFNINVTSVDTGKLVTFRIGVSTFVGFISQVISTTSFKVSGSGLPLANGTPSEVLIIPSVMNTDGVYIGDLPIMRTGGQYKFEMESTETNYLKEMGLPEMRTFRPSVYKTTIGWCPNGDYILLAKGSSLSSYGTLVLRYPRIPMKVYDDTHGIDLPDGMVLNIGIMRLKQLMQERYADGEDRKNMTDFTPQLAAMEKAIYDTHGISQNGKQTVKEAQ